MMTRQPGAERPVFGGRPSRVTGNNTISPVEVRFDGPPIAPISPQLLFAGKTAAGVVIERADGGPRFLFRHAEPPDELRVCDEKLVLLALEHLGAGLCHGGPMSENRGTGSGWESQKLRRSSEYSHQPS